MPTTSTTPPGTPPPPPPDDGASPPGYPDTDPPEASVAVRYLRLLLPLFILIPIAGYTLSVVPLLIPDSVYLGQLRSQLERVDELRAETADFRPGQWSPLQSWRLFEPNTECVALGSNMSPDANVFEDAATSPSFGPCRDFIRGLRASDATPEVYRLYPRYWFGTNVVTRPLISAVGFEATRLAVFGLLVAAFVALWQFTSRRASPTTAAIVIGGLLLSHNWWDSFETWWGIVVATMLLAPIALTGLLRRMSGPWHQRYLVFGLLSGAIFGFVHLLTHIFAAAAVTVLVAVVWQHSHNRNPQRRLATAVLVGAGWFTGFLWAWVSRWLVAAVVLGPRNVIDDISDQLEFRLTGEHLDVVELGLGITSQRMVDYWIAQPATVLFLGVFGILLATYLPRLRGLQAPLVIAFLVVPNWIWFEIFQNHTQIHPHRVWPNIPITIMAATAIARLYVVEDGGLRTAALAQRVRRWGYPRLAEPVLWLQALVGIAIVYVSLTIADRAGIANLASSGRKGMLAVAITVYILGAIAFAVMHRLRVRRTTDTPPADADHNTTSTP